MHQEIVDFHLEGEVLEQNLVKQKETLVRAVEDGMRESGHVPILDIEPQFSLEYQMGNVGKFKFHLTVYGVWVGEESWDVAGVTNGKKILKYTQKPKSSQS